LSENTIAYFPEKQILDILISYSEFNTLNLLEYLI